MFFVAAVVSAIDLQFAYRVEVGGKTAGFVESTAQLEEINAEYCELLKSERSVAYCQNTKLKLAITTGHSIKPADEIAADVLSKDKSLKQVSTLVINGEAVCGVDTENTDLINEICNYLKTFSKTENDTVNFSDNVEVINGYYPAKNLSAVEDVASYLTMANVVTVSVQNYTSEIPYETTQTESSKYIKGYKKVTQKGENGLADVTAVVTYVNGNETNRDVTSFVTLSEPVTEQVVVGTATAVSSSGKANAFLSWPLQRVAKQRISSYWGDGRGHKGIDICSPSGTPIYAALGGTVVHAGWKGDYGYCVIIDHGNGYKTLYGHARELNVSVGQTVSTGDTVAYVGMTGQATGYHLHFELYKNGTRINPINYIIQ